MLELYSETDGYIQDVREGSTFKLHDGRFVSPASEDWRSSDVEYFLVAKTKAVVEADEATLETKLTELQSYRDEAIAKGITVNGSLIHTDDQSQARITGAVVAAQIDPLLLVNWKTANGKFIVLIADEIIAIGKAVRAHVQACFDREAELTDELNSAEDFDTVDLSEGWP